MPTFVQSALNPNGTYQADAMDTAEQANRQAAFQAAQMQNQIAAQQLQAHLENMRMQQQGTQFEEGRADTLGMHGQDIENANRMQGAGFAHDDARLAADIAARNHLADLQFGPQSLASRQFDATNNFNNRLLDMASGGGQSSAPASADPVVNAENHFLPGLSPMPGGAQSAQPMGGGSMDGLSPFQRVAAILAVKNGQPMPNFQAQGLQNQFMQDSLQQHERELAGQRIQQALDAGDINTAHQIAASSGAQMPRIDSTALAARPDVAVKMANVANLAKMYSTSTFGSADDVQRFKAAFDDAVGTLVNHGVNPDEAKAAVAQQVSAVIPARAGAGASFLNKLMGAFVMPMVSGTAGETGRSNQLHDVIGY